MIEDCASMPNAHYDNSYCSTCSLALFMLLGASTATSVTIGSVPML